MVCGSLHLQGVVRINYLQFRAGGEILSSSVLWPLIVELLVSAFRRHRGIPTHQNSRQRYCSLVLHTTIHSGCCILRNQQVFGPQCYSPEASESSAGPMGRCADDDSVLFCCFKIASSVCLKSLESHSHVQGNHRQRSLTIWGLWLLALESITTQTYEDGI